LKIQCKKLKIRCKKLKIWLEKLNFSFITTLQEISILRGFKIYKRKSNRRIPETLYKDNIAVNKPIIAGHYLSNIRTEHS